jgi:hypothetical protein
LSNFLGLLEQNEEENGMLSCAIHKSIVMF